MTRRQMTRGLQDESPQDKYKLVVDGTDLSKLYKQARPTLPDSVIQDVISYVDQKLSKRELCVDVGCGPGQSTELYCPFFKNVVGADISHSQIEEANARRNYGNVTYMEASAECLPLRSNSVALVSAVNAIQWFDQDAFFSEVRRVLVENGVLFVAMHHLRALLEPGMDNWLFQLRKEKFSDYLLSRHMYWDEGYDSIKVPFKGVRRKTMLNKSKLTVSAVMDNINTWSLVIMMREQEPARAEATLAEFRDSWNLLRMPGFFELAQKTSSRTQDADRRERKFTQLLEFLMPFYLLPFVFGNTEGVGIYCVLVTLACLTGGLLPPAVAAMLPLVILPVAGILPADQLAAEFLGPRVLAVWLLFAIAIVCDETTVVARACLYALRRFALRMQPLFLSLQLVVLLLSLFLPSSFIVVLGTVFIERFVAVVQREIIAFDQKSGPRAPTNSSTQNFVEDIRRQRWQRRMATGGSSRKARRVSLVTETDMASDASRGSSLVHQYNMHPERLEERAFDAPKKKVQPSSILKGSSSKGKEQESGTHSPCRTATATKTTKPETTTPKSRQQPGSRVDVVRTVESDDDGGSSRTPSRESSSKSMDEPAKRALVKLVDKPGVEPSVIQQTTSGPADDKPRGSGRLVEPAPAEDVAPPSPGEELSGLQQLHQTPSALTPSTTMLSPSTSPFSVSSHSSASSTPQVTVLEVWNTAPVGACGEDKVESYATWASHVMSGPGSRLLLPGDEEAAAASSSLGRSTESTTMKTAVEDEPQPSKSTSVAPENGRSVVKRDTALGFHSQKETEQSGWKLLQLQKNAASPPDSSAERLFEVRGLFKSARSSVSAQSSPQRQQESPASRRVSLTLMDNDTEMAATMNGVVTTRRCVMYDSARRRTAAAGRNENGTSARRIIASQPYLGGEAASSYLDFGDEQVSSCIRLHTLILAVRPVLIAGTAYTAIFGNLISLNTVPTRNAVLVNLGCNATQCAVSWWSWAMMALPAALTCCLICWIYACCASLVTCTVRETLLIYWLIGVPVTYGAYIIRNPRGYLEGPLFGLSVVGMSMMPGLTRNHYWSRRMLCWDTICARMPWNVIIMLGCVMALTRVVEFWTRRSTKANQFILSSMAALLSEMIVGDTLGNVLTPVVVRVAVVTNAPAAFYVVPVNLAASINVMLPVSVPLLIMREYLNFQCAKMVAYGVFLKCTAVLLTVASMNTLGTIFFSSEGLSTNQASALSTVNATHVVTGPMQ
ncbi:hypothetical protein HPB52_015669 [Rhipicephalus sanguineus]|uniref:Methyltransferase type 11 domain-containing protein n=2 Tax=Rhipicephalus sanguineus TaxID=34632 RepID=A0A9D4PWV5_RHISA|nr:hypothetical protein HPB52_015669 [Rhipicephalus sanguineus]